MAENNASLKITKPTSFSVIGPCAKINLTNVIGAYLSVAAISLKSSVWATGFAFICLCSIIRFTLERKRNEFITAVSKATEAIISTCLTIDIVPYIEPRVKEPESTGDILIGHFRYLQKTNQTSASD